MYSRRISQLLLVALFVAPAVWATTAISVNQVTLDVEASDDVEVVVSVACQHLLVLTMTIEFDPEVVSFVEGSGVFPEARLLRPDETGGPPTLRAVAGQPGRIVFNSDPQQTAFSDPRVTVFAGTGALFRFRVAAVNFAQTALTVPNASAILAPSTLSDTVTTSPGSVDVQGTLEVVYDPPAGYYNAQVDVTMTAFGSSAIHYTTDGSMPTASSPAFSDPVPILGADGETIVLQVLVLDSHDPPRGLRDSASYIFDFAAPTATIAAVAPDPRDTPVGSIDIVFNEPAPGLQLADLSLTRDTGPISLASAALSSGDDLTWVLSGLEELTGDQGAYVLTVLTTVTDRAGNPLAAQAQEAWTVDLPPTVEIQDVAAVSNQPVTAVTFVFSEAVTGFDRARLTLGRNGGGNLLSDTQTLTTSDNVTWVLAQLAAITSTDGVYQLALNATGVTDLTAKPLVSGDQIAWILDTVPPQATITPVSPDPRRAAVASIAITFDAAIVGFALADLQLQRDSGPNLLTSQSLTTSDGGRSWLLSGLSGVTGVDGIYVLTLADAAVMDAAGNPLSGAVSETWRRDTQPPVATIVGVTPDPRNQSLASLSIRFDEPVTGLNIGALSLTRDGGANLLTGTETVTTQDLVTWSILGLSGLTSAHGVYTLTLDADAATITDAAGNASVADASASWTMDTVPPVVDFLPVAQTPRNTPIASLVIVFDEPVTAFDVTDLVLERDAGANLLGAGQTLTSSDSQTWTLGGLTAVTGDHGDYLLTLSPQADVTDIAGNPPTSGDTTAWRMDIDPPVATLVAVVPALTNQAVTSITVDFDEPVTGLLSSHFELLRDDLTVSLTAATLATTDNQSWQLSGLGSLTAADGDYVLRLPATAAVTDGVGNSLATAAEVAWTMDATAPEVTIEVVSPDPRETSVAALRLTFSEPVNGFALADLALTRDGGENLLGGQLDAVDAQTWDLTNLDAVTAADGHYLLALAAAAAGIADLAGNALQADGASTWTMDAQGPVLSLIPETELLVFNDAAPDLLAGVTATDLIDGVLDPAGLVVEGSVTMTVAGDYAVVYRATDSRGHETEATRIYHVGFRISGTITYDGPQLGDFVLGLTPQAGGALTPVELGTATGPFVVVVTLSSGSYDVVVFRDTDGDREIDPDEAVDSTRPAVNLADNPSSLSFSLADWEQQLTLQPGWNLISFPGPLLAGEFARLEALATGDAWCWHGTYFRPAEQDLPHLGLWLFVLTMESPLVRGLLLPTVDQPTAVQAGWNLVGVSTAMLNPSGRVAGVLGSTWHWLPPRLRPVPPDATIAPFAAIWIYADHAFALNP